MRIGDAHPGVAVDGGRFRLGRASPMLGTVTRTIPQFQRSVYIVGMRAICISLMVDPQESPGCLDDIRVKREL